MHAVCITCRHSRSITEADAAAPVDHEEGAALDECLAQHVLGPPVARDHGVPVPRVARQLHVAIAAPMKQPAQACVCGSRIFALCLIRVLTMLDQIQADQGGA
jgi:hypothetical protein